MAIAIISDVHIKQAGDKQEKTLMNFFLHPKTQDAQTIILLGDIFDFLIGPHSEYFQDYPLFFEKVEVFLKSGKKVYFVEGNHDLYLQKLFEKRYSQYFNKNLFLETGPFNLVVNEKKILFTHGDELDFKNLSYELYKIILRSPPLSFLANYVLNYQTLVKIGRKASAKSRDYGSRIFDQEKVKKDFREGALKYLNSGHDIVIAGHSHVKDFKQLGGGLYVNNGYAPKEQTFVFIDEKGDVSFNSL